MGFHNNLGFGQVFLSETLVWCNKYLNHRGNEKVKYISKYVNFRLGKVDFMLYEETTLTSAICQGKILQQ